jgi:hypothetical protein
MTKADKIAKKPTKIKFKIIRAHWQKMEGFGFKVEDNSGYWYFLQVIYPDGDRKTYSKPLKTFNEALTVFVEYLARLRAQKIIDAKAESEARSIILSQEEKKQKDPSKMIYVAAAITTIIGTPISIGISVYSALNQKKTQVPISQDKKRKKNRSREKDSDSPTEKLIEEYNRLKFLDEEWEANEGGPGGWGGLD